MQLFFASSFIKKLIENWAWKLENRCVRENSIKNRFLAALFGPRIDFWCSFGSRPGPKIEIFWPPVHLIFQKNFTSSSKGVWIGVRRLRERPRDPPGTLQGPSRGLSGDPPAIIFDFLSNWKFELFFNCFVSSEHHFFKHLVCFLWLTMIVKW